jgi:hypothetical protein
MVMGLGKHRLGYDGFESGPLSHVSDKKMMLFR